MDAMQYNGLTLAYIGDCIYELRIRNYVLSLGLTKVNDLHKEAIKFTKGQAQSYVMHHMIDNNMLSELEYDMFKRGRNSSVAKVRKNISRSDYLEGTGFESLIGYLYLTGNITRMDEIIDLAINLIKNKKED
jgi:ribonuclease-3 family protein